MLENGILGGACSASNVALISGALHMHKIGKYDLLRSVMHSLGHLFGGNHDRTVNSNCKDSRFSNFINPFLLDPLPQINVGLRPNSMKMSPCARLDISLFLTSPNFSCLRTEESKFCGNGTAALRARVFNLLLKCANCQSEIV